MVHLHTSRTLRHKPRAVLVFLQATRGMLRTIQRHMAATLARTMIHMYSYSCAGLRDSVAWVYH